MVISLSDNRDCEVVLGICSDIVDFTGEYFNSGQFRVIPHYSSRIPHNSSRIPHNSSRIPHNSSRIPHNSSRIPHNSSRIPHNGIPIGKPSFTCLCEYCVLYVS